MSIFHWVKGEEATLDLVLAGKSIARYGDGEFNLVRGRKSMPQKFDKACMAELQMILKSDNEDCLVGVPYLPQSMPKKRRESWAKWLPSYEKYLSQRKQYYSAFITRPDSAPNIDTPAYFEKMSQLWKGKRVALVFGGSRSLTPEFLMATGAAEVGAILCSYEDAYAQIDYLTNAAVKSEFNRVLLCAGPTATCLAHRLSRRGRHAVDLGHVGMFWPGEKILAGLAVKSAEIKASGAIKQLEDGYWYPEDSRDAKKRRHLEALVAKNFPGGEALCVNNAGTGTLVNLLALKYDRLYAVEKHPGRFGALRRNLKAANVLFFPEDISRWLPKGINTCRGVP